ncbi:YihY/virulence factor BrkB family protein [Bradyrhizobium sp. JYMT SZCCT0428]|uniref:YihY/virulence factor BrkB family protein n=1 Tax=Bradyrhizobium sp. JYMT SZCCT0428 TaxID=2807673 RepID=UPI001BA52A95|nr:YihY/virulence factor BrkB family protein [Bradyrhizobium sp. JYMT SZCCT0428]MBR1157387.1 YihY/virulence factor BrkB family protein [Bradyrhizobium sp. JYMT SZCCT0428]
MDQIKKPGIILSIALLGLDAAARYLVAGRKPILARGSAKSAPSRASVELQTGHAGGRGQNANSPAEVPAQGWKEILWRTYQQINEDRLLAIAAGVVFYALLALFPGITALVSSYALFADAATVNAHLEMLSGMLPPGTFSVVQDQVGRVLAKGEVTLGAAFLFSFALALWSANGGTKAIIDALNVVYDEKEERGFFKLNAVSLAFTLGGLVGILAAIGLVIAAPIVLASFGLGSVSELLLKYARWPALAVLILLGLAVLYRYGPSRKTPKWKWISVGSAVATVTWLIGSGLLSYYLSNYGNYDATYGSLGAAIGLLIWMWMSTIVILLGAELNSEIEHQAGKNPTNSDQDRAPTSTLKERSA